MSFDLCNLIADQVNDSKSNYLAETEEEVSNHHTKDHVTLQLERNRSVTVWVLVYLGIIQTASDVEEVSGGDKHVDNIHCSNCESDYRGMKVIIGCKPQPHVVCQISEYRQHCHDDPLATVDLLVNDLPPSTKHVEEGHIPCESYSVEDGLSSLYHLCIGCSVSPWTIAKEQT